MRRTFDDTWHLTPSARPSVPCYEGVHGAWGPMSRCIISAAADLPTVACALERRHIACVGFCGHLNEWWEGMNCGMYLSA